MDKDKLSQQIDFFVNRVKKNYTRLKKWVRRNEVECYRLYERDIPDIPIVLDIYGEYLHAALLRRYTQDSENAEYSGSMLVMAVAKELGIPSQNVFIKFRERQKGLAQYEKMADEQQRLVVRENGLRFFVNLTDYLDTGLFLDHRTTRMMVRDEAAGKRVLNLFSYTGSFSVYAAAGGARETTTVDLSNTYLDWARDNFALNGLDGASHHFVREDVLKYLSDCAVAKREFDLVVLDPPTFSNSKRMQDSFDVQNDYVELISRTLRVIPIGGVLYFSTNYKKFKFDPAQFQAGKVIDITKQTIPIDFRDQRIHSCWKLIK